jgi:hypothetical protein
MRPLAGSVREITSSLLLEDSQEHLEPNELSSSLLVEDTSAVDMPPLAAPIQKPSPPTLPKDSSDFATLPVGEMSSITTADILPGPDAPAGTATAACPRPPSPTRVDASVVPWPQRLRGVAGVIGWPVARAWERIAKAAEVARSLFALKRARWWVPGLAALVLVVVGVYLAGARDGPRSATLADSRSKGRARDEDRAPDKLPSSALSDALLASTGAGSAANNQDVAPASPARGCTVSGPARVVAETALLAAGVEVRTLRTGVGLGFVPADHQATVVRVDPKTLAVGQMVNVRATDVIHRVTPILSPSGVFSPGIDVDPKNDKVFGRRTIPVEPPIQVGTQGGQLMWTRASSHAMGKLWGVDVGTDVDAIRGAWAPGIDHGVVALAFRRAGAVWVGTIDTSGVPSPIGNLSRIAGLGPSVGSPAIAFDGATLMMAWADRAASDDPWRLRLVRFRNGDSPGEPSTFSPPPGGRGGQAMSPGLAVVPGVGFLLTWTEGAISAHEVRAVTLANDGSPMGAPLTISNEGVNAGQGQAAIDLDGYGLVAFLQGGGGVFQIAATPIACPVRTSQ